MTLEIDLIITNDSRKHKIINPEKKNKVKIITAVASLWFIPAIEQRSQEGLLLKLLLRRDPAATAAALATASRPPQPVFSAFATIFAGKEHPTSPQVQRSIKTRAGGHSLTAA